MSLHDKRNSELIDRAVARLPPAIFVANPVHMSKGNIFSEAKSVDWRRPSVIALVAANLWPVFGVTFLGWNLFPLVMFYWCENLVAGFFGLLMSLCGSNPKYPWGSLPKRLAWSIFLAGFFSIHFGAFCIGYGSMLAYFFGGEPDHALLKNYESSFSLSIAPALFKIVWNHQLFWPVAGLFISQAVPFVTDYIGKKQYQRATGALMGYPYLRLIPQIPAIFPVAIIVWIFKAPILAFGLIVLVKTFVDVMFYLKFQEKFKIQEMSSQDQTDENEVSGPDEARTQ